MLRIIKRYVLIISSMAMFKSLSTLYMKKGANDQVKSSRLCIRTNSTLSGQVGYGLIMNKFHIPNSKVRPVKE